MRKKSFNTVNFEGFISQFMQPDGDASFQFQAAALQIYPLTMASTFIQPPTPLFRTQYNFLLLFRKGGGTQQVDNEIIALQANDVLFIREGHLNSIQSIDPDTEGYFIYIDNALLPQIFVEETSLNRFSFHPKSTVTMADMDWLCQCCQLILQQKTEDVYAAEIQSTLLKAMILKISKASSWGLPQLDRPTEITMKFKELLYENFIKEREIAFYSNALAVTENYLNRCVKNVTNKPPKQHINEMVIYYSKVLLMDRAKTISEIAFALNFSDPSYFGRLFKQITEQTPTQYRQSFMQDLSE
ncbi:MAG: helix-turn-helix domain-containing protein [Bacteroidota bacterium]